MASLMAYLALTLHGFLHCMLAGLYISSCSIDIRWFPFDDQFCQMKFGSWTYDGSKINLTTMSDVIDTSTYSISGEWNLIGKSVQEESLWCYLQTTDPLMLPMPKEFVVLLTVY